jgi:hypothetical protein
MKIYSVKVTYQVSEDSSATEMDHRLSKLIGKLAYDGSTLWPNRWIEWRRHTSAATRAIMNKLVDYLSQPPSKNSPRLDHWEVSMSGSDNPVDKPTKKTPAKRGARAKK